MIPIQVIVRIPRLIWLTAVFSIIKIQLKFMQWAKKLTKIFTFNLSGTPCIACHLRLEPWKNRCGKPPYQLWTYAKPKGPAILIVAIILWCCKATVTSYLHAEHMHTIRIAHGDR